MTAKLKLQLCKRDAKAFHISKGQQNYIQSRRTEVQKSSYGITSILVLVPLLTLWR